MGAEAESADPSTRVRDVTSGSGFSAPFNGVYIPSKPAARSASVSAAERNREVLERLKRQNQEEE